MKDREEGMKGEGVKRWEEREREERMERGDTEMRTGEGRRKDG